MPEGALVCPARPGLLRSPAGTARESSELSEALLRAAVGGDEWAFTRLYRLVHPRLLRYLTVLVGSEAEDVAAEVWADIAGKLASFSGSMDGFRGWAATIARSKAFDHLRERGRRPTVQPLGESQLALPDPAGSAEDGALTDLSTRRALALIARLPPDQAEAVLLRAVVGLDAAAAGRVLGKRAGAVRVAAHRGLRRLAEILDEERRGGAGSNTSGPDNGE